MTYDQTLVVAILVVTLVMFVWGRVRYDVVALGALLAGVIAGVIPTGEAFSGFGHPAVITVAAVLVISRTLSTTGALDRLSALIERAADKPVLQIVVLSATGAVLSGFMNNVGALALLMPVAMQSAAKADRSPAAILMPLSFGSILGGLVTLIGTPPNIIIATYRGTAMGEPFAMFDFAPVGGAVAVVGLIFMALIGWRLIPADRRGRSAPGDLFEIDDYVAELHPQEDSDFIGKPVSAIEDAGKGDEVLVVGVIRGERRMLVPVQRRILRANDIVLVRGESDAITKLASAAGLKFAGSERPLAKELQSDDIVLMEAVVTRGSMLEGRTPTAVSLRERFGVNLLALSRQGARIMARLSSTRLRTGDVLLLQGDADRMPDVLTRLGCLPLVQRGLTLRKPRRAIIAALVFGVAIVATAVSLVPAAIALAAAVVAFVLSGVLSVRDLYDGIDWPVIVLLAAMIPVGHALETTGATGLVSELILRLGEGYPVYVVLGFLLVVTMTLSDVMNNAATAVVMAPIAAGVAAGLGFSADPFLMAVAIGASCAFLTPIGHQNNALVMGPGGYHFGDYWRVGLPLEVLIVVISVPLLLVVWPLQG